jgi:hypothetical protein
LSIARWRRWVIGEGTHDLRVCAMLCAAMAEEAG